MDMDNIKTAVGNLVTVLGDLGNDGDVEDTLRGLNLNGEDLFDVLVDLAETLTAIEDVLEGAEDA